MVVALILLAALFSWQTRCLVQGSQLAEWEILIGWFLMFKKGWTVVLDQKISTLESRWQVWTSCVQQTQETYSTNVVLPGFRRWP